MRRGLSLAMRTSENAPFPRGSVNKEPRAGLVQSFAPIMGTGRRHPAQRRWQRVRAGKRVRSTSGAVGRDETRGRRTHLAGAQDTGRFQRRSGSRRPQERQGAGGDLVGERARDGRHRGGGTFAARFRRRSRRRDDKGRGEVRGLLRGSEGYAAIVGLALIIYRRKGKVVQL